MLLTVLSCSNEVHKGGDSPKIIEVYSEEGHAADLHVDGGIDLTVIKGNEMLISTVEEIKSQETLLLKFEELKVIDGEEVLAMMSKDVGPSDEEYIYAVYDYLLKSGFDCRFKE